MRILGIGGSIRASFANDQVLTKLVSESERAEHYLNAVQALVSASTKPGLSNTEIGLGLALMGAKAEGAEVDYFSLIQLFRRRENKVENFDAEKLDLDESIGFIDTLSLNPKVLSRLEKLLEGAVGIIFSSPVYFGDRSSVANKFLQLTQKKSLLRDKSFGVVSVGAKRNGGQETTNVFSLYEALAQGAIGVGNGPKTSQYGGTAVAGDKGLILGDAWGLETFECTGRRVAQVARILVNSKLGSPIGRPVKIKILSTMDFEDQRSYANLQELVARSDWFQDKGVAFEIINLLKGDIYRCIACNICPIPEKRKLFSEDEPTSYSCIIQNRNDSVEDLRNRLLEADGIVVAGINPSEDDIGDVIFRYQSFIERTRFIRRNDFELSNVPVAGFSVSEVGSNVNQIHNLKVMCSYMRHNGIMLQPMEEIHHKGEVLKDGVLGFNSFVDSVVRITRGRLQTRAVGVQYIAGGDGGYEDSRLDQTRAERM